MISPQPDVNRSVLSLWRGVISNPSTAPLILGMRRSRSRSAVAKQRKLST